MMKNKQFIQAAFVAGLLLAVGCNNDRMNPEMENNDPVELQISPVVSLSRGVIAGDASANQAALGSVAVYASGHADYTSQNNYAIYTWGTSWASGTDKIYLTNANATIHAHYPAYTPDQAGTPTSTPLKAANSKIAVTVLETGSIDANGTGILASAGEVDYMWATAVADVNNNSNNTNVTLAMNHALARVSFRVYKAADYFGTGALSKIVLKNKQNGSSLSKGTSPVMNITDGTITENTAQAATFTRNISNYTIGTEKSSAKQVSLLVLPINTAFDSDAIQLEITVDGAAYTVNLTPPDATLNGSGNAGKWFAGKNYLYTAKLSGSEFSITTVTVAPWEDKVIGGDLEIK